MVKVRVVRSRPTLISRVTNPHENGNYIVGSPTNLRLKIFPSRNLAEEARGISLRQMRSCLGSKLTLMRTFTLLKLIPVTLCTDNEKLQPLNSLEKSRQVLAPMLH